MRAATSLSLIHIYLVATEDGFVAAGSADLEEVFEAFGLEPPDEDEDLSLIHICFSF